MSGKKGIILIVLLIIGFEGFKYSNNEESVLKIPQNVLADLSTTKKFILNEIKETFDHELQFFSQAPIGNWNLPYQEACEESSIILAMNYILDKEMTLEEFHEELLKIINFEKENFGYYEDTNVSKTNEIINGFYNYENTEIISNPTVDTIKRILNNGGIVIAPLAGRNIENPYYSPPGPYYHMLVIKGYDKENFITHDVGTKRGENFKYRYDVIIDNIHDFDPEFIERGENRIIAVYK